MIYNNMLLEMLIVFIIITVILFILSVIFMDDAPMVAVPILFTGMVFTILCAFGFFEVDTVYLGQNLSTGAIEPMIYSNEAYNTAYPWVFFFLFILFAIVFLRIGFNLLMEAKQTMGEMNYRGRRR